MGIKLISDSYLYKKTGYGKNLLEYLLKSEAVDKNNDSFSDIVYEVKKHANNILIKVLMSNKVVLLMSEKGVSKAFKVLYAKDVRSDDKEKKRVYIDCSGLISQDENGKYTCKKVTILVSYLITAMTYLIYYENNRAITSSNTLTKSGASAFADLMLYVLSYLKVPVSYADNKGRMSFVLAEYYQTCIVGIPADASTIYNVAKQISKLEDKKTCDYLHTLFNFTFTDGCDIEKFIAKFAEVFLDQKEDKESPTNRTRLTVDVLAQRWMYAFGPGTFLGLECFVPFSQMLTDCYNGAFLNNQNTIEKIANSKTIVTFSNELLKIGSES